MREAERDQLQEDFAELEGRLQGLQEGVIGLEKNVKATGGLFVGRLRKVFGDWW